MQAHPESLERIVQERSGVQGARMRLDPASTPLKLVLLTALDLCPVFMPDPPRLLDPVSLFLTDERSDAAVVGSGNKAMGKSPLLTF